MNVGGKHYRTIWREEKAVRVIDQRFLPHGFVVEEIGMAGQMAAAIKEMHIRGAVLLEAAGSYGMYLAAQEQNGELKYIENAASMLRETRPTAVNLGWAIDKQLSLARDCDSDEERTPKLLESAEMIIETSVDNCRLIGQRGLKIIQAIANKNKKQVNILTHCNAGWLGCVDYGTALSPIYAAYDCGIDVHVWVDETRPRNQGSNLTAWELGQHGVPYTIISDNSGGHLMQHGMVDLVIVGADRVTRTGDTANKIGTYLKALAAKDNDVPFYVALPLSSFDPTLSDGVREIAIEERGAEEVKYAQGLLDGEIKTVLVAPQDSRAANYGFDVTPSRLISGFITENGICDANESSIEMLNQNLFREKV